MTTESKMIGSVTKTGAVQVFFLRFSGNVSTRPQFTAWAESSEIDAAQDNHKTRRARVWLRTYDQSKVWERVCKEVRVPADLPDEQAHCLAMHKAHRQGKAYSLLMWIRKRIAEVHPALVEDPEFKAHLRNIAAEFPVSGGSEGLQHVARMLKLGSFEASAFPVSLNK